MPKLFAQYYPRGSRALIKNVVLKTRSATNKKQKAARPSWLLVFIFMVFGVLAPVARATEFTSTNFRVLDPVLHIASSTEMSSTNFRLLGTVGQIAIGTSSATTFNISSGFLYFPVVTSPVVTATAGDGKVDLSWTASQGFLGWTVSEYNVGQSIAAGGPYTYSSSLGNVTVSSRTGLTNGTAYYFVVRAEDAFGNSIATSSEVSATPAAAAAPAPSGGGGGIIETLLKIIGRPQAAPPLRPRQPDLNGDGKIDLADLSILMYYTSRDDAYLADLTNDRRVDIKDLSALFFSWTGKQKYFEQGTETAQTIVPRVKPSGENLAFIGQPSAEENAGSIRGIKDAGRIWGNAISDFFYKIYSFARNSFMGIKGVFGF